MTFLNRLARCTSDGQIKALPDFNHSFSPTLRVAEVEAHPRIALKSRGLPGMFANSGMCNGCRQKPGGHIIKSYLPVRQHRQTRLLSHGTILVRQKNE
jgi:hypothetical protein